MKRVFISGPLTSSGDLATNLNNATAAFLELARAGLFPFCPHWSAYAKPAFRFKSWDDAVVCIATAEGAPGMSHDDWLTIDCAWVSVSDAVLRLPGASLGADRETAHASALNIPIFHTVADVIAWATNTSLPHGAD